MTTYKIIVLKDGETWELAKGTQILEITEEAYDKLLMGEDATCIGQGDIISKKEAN